MLGSGKKFDFQILATTMMGAVSNIFDSMCSEKFSDSPGIKKNIIIQQTDNGRMTASGAKKKYYGGCHISVINYYIDARHMEKKKTCGAVIVYIKTNCLVKLFKALGYPILDDKDEDILSDICGEFCNMIAGGFKGDLAGIGYVDMCMSAPSNYLNIVTPGVEYRRNQKEYYELTFYLWDTNAVTVDVTLSPIPLKQPVTIRNRS